MQIPLFNRIDELLDQGKVTESELEMIKLAIIELAQDEDDPESETVGTDGRDLVLHARDACADAGIDFDDAEDGDDDDAIADEA
jgi:hypothetical protein